MLKREDDVRCVAGILVGGQSIRMGRPKATLPLSDGRTLVEHGVSVVSRSGPWIDEVVILGHCSDLPVSLSSLTVLPDAKPGAGPLAGLCSLIRYAEKRWALLLACDMPLVEPALLGRLHRAISLGCDAVAFRQCNRPGIWHTCCALYHPRLLPLAERRLEQGHRSLQHLLAAVRMAELHPTPDEQRAMLNLNAPGDYDLLVHHV